MGTRRIAARGRFLGCVLLTLALFLGGCTPYAPEAAPSPAQAQALTDYLDAHLGVLADRVTPEERARAMTFVEQLWPLRQERLDTGGREPSGRERRLLEQLNRLYERYTAQYLDGGGTWGYADPTQRLLAEYRITSDGTLKLLSGGEEDHAPLWRQITGLLPQGAFRDFTRFTVFTDGPDETLAYVTALDSGGCQWEIAVDPADAVDEGWFTETVLHEYCHYLTLNQDQVRYTDRPSGDTYSEPGMSARPGSYLDDFYQAFWSGYLDDRLVNPDSYQFYLRHEDDFVTDYASTDPSEDIAECFTYFALWEPREGDEVWVRKLNFFFDYPELETLRGQIRARLGMD